MANYTIFIFRRDLRLKDNIGLQYAIKNFENIIPIFIFTPEQITDKNKFKSNNAIQFMIESLKELDDDLQKYNSRLHIYQDDNISALSRIDRYIKKNITKSSNESKIVNIVFNKDYTVYSQKRDTEIEKWCSSNNIKCYQLEDYLLAPIGTFLKKDGDPYTVYTPFKNFVLDNKKHILEPISYKIKNLISVSDDKLKTDGFIDFKYNNPNILIHGGRKTARKILKNIKKFNKYDSSRNDLSYNTTHLSAYIKFGCVSIRECYDIIKKELGVNSTLVSQLIWREFYFYIGYYFPRVLKGENYNKDYDKLEWNKDNTLFKKWCLGETGYPIVDACMKELNTTGYMHNRGRLIAANFVNRMLGQDWRKGEKYFAQQLTDYDPIVNNGNWQWIASTGVDPKPYFQRLFNPWLQGQKNDNDAEYIKKWLPQLKDIPAKELNDWENYYKNYDLKKINYLAPIVNYKEARQKSVEMYRNK